MTNIIHNIRLTPFLTPFFSLKLTLAAKIKRQAAEGSKVPPSLPPPSSLPLLYSSRSSSSSQSLAASSFRGLVALHLRSEVIQFIKNLRLCLGSSSVATCKIYKLCMQDESFLSPMVTESKDSSCFLLDLLLCDILSITLLLFCVFGSPSLYFHVQ